jgi:hypothetical protein
MLQFVCTLSMSLCLVSSCLWLRSQHPHFSAFPASPFCYLMTYPSNSIAFHGPSWVWAVWPAPALPPRDYADPHEFIQTTKTCCREFEISGESSADTHVQIVPWQTPPLHEGLCHQVVLSNNPLEGHGTIKAIPSHGSATSS